MPNLLRVLLLLWVSCVAAFAQGPVYSAPVGGGNTCGSSGTPCTVPGQLNVAGNAQIGNAVLSPTAGLNGLINGVSIQSLATGLLLNTTGTGAPSIATWITGIQPLLSGTIDSSHVVMANGTTALITSAFSAVTAGTNAAALVMGTGGSLGVSGSGTIAATSVSGFTAGVGTLTGPASSGTAVIGAAALSTSGCVPYQNGTAGALTCDPIFTYADVSNNVTFGVLNAQGGTTSFILKGGNSQIQYQLTAASGSPNSLKIGINGNAQLGLSSSSPYPVTIGFGSASSVTAIFNGIPAFNGTNTTGSTLFAPAGSNCPAITCTTPYTWLQFQSADGSAVFSPVFK